LAITKMERLEKQWQCQEMERQKIQDKIQIAEAVENNEENANDVGGDEENRRIPLRTK